LNFADSRDGHEAACISEVELQPKVADFSRRTTVPPRR
jgi:hypothetical protein